jgi:hypothetical protein
MLQMNLDKTDIINKFEDLKSKYTNCFIEQESNLSGPLIRAK